MPKWEYKVVRVHGTDTEGLSRELSGYGNEGWDLHSVHQAGTTPGAAYHVIFKRQVEPDPSSGVDPEQLMA